MKISNSKSINSWKDSMTDIFKSPFCNHILSSLWNNHCYLWTPSRGQTQKWSLCLTASNKYFQYQLSVFLCCLWVKITFMFIISFLQLIKLPSFKSLAAYTIQTTYSTWKDSLTTHNLCSPSFRVHHLNSWPRSKIYILIPVLWLCNLGDVISFLHICSSPAKPV